MLAIKSRAKFEQVASKIRSFRDLIASKCTYDSEPHCTCTLFINRHLKGDDIRGTPVFPYS